MEVVAKILRIVIVSILAGYCGYKAGCAKNDDEAGKSIIFLVLAILIVSINACIP